MHPGGLGDAYDAEIRYSNGVHSSHLVVRLSASLLLARNLLGGVRWLALLALKCFATVVINLVLLIEKYILYREPRDRTA